MTEESHSLLGASSISRRMKCPGSYYLEGISEKRPSAAAISGREAHAFLEEYLESNERPQNIDDATYDAIKVAYDYIAEKKKEYQHVLVESKVSLEEIDPELYGTADVILLKLTEVEDTVYFDAEVIDYKHGSSVYVDVKDNPQCLFYLLGAFYMIARSVTNLVFRKGTITIIQPRCTAHTDAIRSQTLDDISNFEYALMECVKRVRVRNIKNLDLSPSPDACLFCSGKAICPALRERIINMKDDTELSEFSISSIKASLDWLRVVKTWISDVEYFAKTYVKENKDIGWKVRTFRQVRDWGNPQWVTSQLRSLGVPDSEIFKQEVKSPSMLEKYLGKEAWNVVKKDIVLKNQGESLVKDNEFHMEPL